MIRSHTIAVDHDLPPVESTAKPRTRHWFGSIWFQIAYLAAVLFVLGVGLATNTSDAYLLSQVALAAAFYVSLLLLADRRLINSLQAGVFFFYWWFGIAPAAIGAKWALLGFASKAIDAQEIATGAILIVALGLPLFGLAGRWVLKLLERRGLYVRFLIPSGPVYRPRTLLVYWLVGTGAALLIKGLEAIGVQGLTVVNYLGGTRTDIWGIGILGAIQTLSTWAAAAIVFSLVTNWRKSPVWLKLLAGLIFVQTLANALTSGWKSSFVTLFLVLALVLMYVRQRPPWRLLLVIGLLFITVVEPFVTAARQLALASNAQSSTDRQAVFLQYLGEVISRPALGEWENLNVDTYFRGIYPLAGEIVRTTTVMEGLWNGRTIGWGLQTIVPRALFPEKPESSVGNYFSRTIGAAVGVSSPDNNFNSVALSIPFEFVGNYGWAAGIVSFALLGSFWALWCGVLLSPQRVSSHPLSSLFAISAMTMEQPLGDFLAVPRNLIFVLGVAFVLWLLLRRRI